MTQTGVDIIITLLESKGAIFDKGLSQEEIENIEDKFNFSFSPELRLFLETVNPLSEGFINWRYSLNSKKGFEEAKHRLNWPLEGILFDVKHNNFWITSLGDKPKDKGDQLELVRQYVSNQPILIPIYSHRYAVSGNVEGSPILSVYQTDIIYYGNNLYDYLANEFNFILPDNLKSLPANVKVPFWTEITG